MSNKMRKNAGCNFGGLISVCPLPVPPLDAKSITLKFKDEIPSDVHNWPSPVYGWPKVKGDFGRQQFNEGKFEYKVTNLEVEDQTSEFEGTRLRDQMLREFNISIRHIGTITKDTVLIIDPDLLTEEEMVRGEVSMVGWMNNDVFTSKDLQNAELSEQNVSQLEEVSEEQVDMMMQLNKETSEKLRLKDAEIEVAKIEHAEVLKQLLLIEESAKENDGKISDGDEKWKSPRDNQEGQTKSSKLTGIGLWC